MRSGFMSVQIVDGECEAGRCCRRAERRVQPVVPSALGQLRARNAVVDSETKSGVVAGVLVKVVEMQRKVRKLLLDRGPPGRRQRLDALEADASGASLRVPRRRRGQ